MQNVQFAKKNSTFVPRKTKICVICVILCVNRSPDFILIEMPIENTRNTITLPEPSLRRLPWYLAYVKLLRDRGVEYVSSTQISKEINVDSSQIAKDLSFINITGKTRVGYEVASLVDALEAFLGFGEMHKAVIFGVGSLGAALLQDSGLAQYGMKVVAGFDVSPTVVHTRINGIPVYDVADFPRIQRELDAHIGILTVPVDMAQKACDDMIRGGVKAIWNFTPYRIKTPENIVVQNTSIYAHLAVMFNRLNHLEQDK